MLQNTVPLNCRNEPSRRHNAYLPTVRARSVQIPTVSVKSWYGNLTKRLLTTGLDIETSILETASNGEPGGFKILDLPLGTGEGPVI